MMGRALGVALLCALSGCVSGFWGIGLPDEGPEPQGVVPNGLVLSTGPATWLEVAERITLSWNELPSEGLIFDSEGLNHPSEMRSMLAASPPSWEAAAIRPGQVALTAGPAGLLLEVDVDLESVLVTLEEEGQPSCFVEVTIPEGRLSGTLTLTKSKVGVVTLSSVGDAAFREEDALFSLTACQESVSTLSGLPEGPEARALGALATAAFEALAPTIGATLPSGMGLDFAGATTVSFADGGEDAGWLHTVIRAPLVAPSPWWQYASGRVMVPYSVGISAEPHACVPESPLPLAKSAAVPVVDADWALLMNHELISRQFAAIWLSGGLCADRLTNDVVLPSALWREVWPALEHLGEEAQVSARLWPETAPTIVFNAAPDGSDVVLDVDGGTWTVELMGERDGARVRLATLRVSVGLTSALVVDMDGSLWLSPEEVSVALRGVESGLLELPEKEESEAALEASVEAMVSAWPVWSVPSLPAGVIPTVALHDAYLVIRDL